MAPLDDQTLLRAYTNALENRRFEGYVVWTQVALHWIRRELDGVTAHAISSLMYEHVVSGGEIDQVVETRAEWCHLYPFHYDFRFPILGREIYIETRLIFDDPEDPDDPVILVANIHDR